MSHSHVPSRVILCMSLSSCSVRLSFCSASWCSAVSAENRSSNFFNFSVCRSSCRRVLTSSRRNSQTFATSLLARGLGGCLVFVRCALADDFTKLLLCGNITCSRKIVGKVRLNFHRQIPQIEICFLLIH